MCLPIAASETTSSAAIARGELLQRIAAAAQQLAYHLGVDHRSAVRHPVQRTASNSSSTQERWTYARRCAAAPASRS